MKASQNYNDKIKKRTGLCFLFMLLILVYGCKKDKVSEPLVIEETAQSETIEIISNNMDFQMPDSISSGWHTFKYDNRSNETHFFLVDKYPEGLSIENMEKEVGPAGDELDH